MNPLGCSWGHYGFWHQPFFLRHILLRSYYRCSRELSWNPYFSKGLVALEVTAAKLTVVDGGTKAPCPCIVHLHLFSSSILVHYFGCPSTKMQPDRAPCEYLQRKGELRSIGEHTETRTELFTIPTYQVPLPHEFGTSPTLRSLD